MQAAERQKAEITAFPQWGMSHAPPGTVSQAGQGTDINDVVMS